MLHVLYGPDSFTVHEELRRILEEHPSTEGGTAEAVRLDGKTTTPTEIDTACHQFSLFNQARSVVVDGLLARFEPPKQSKDGGQKAKAKRQGLPPEWQGFAADAGALPQESVLVLIDGELKPANYLLKALKTVPGADVREMLPPRGNDLLDWIRERAMAAGLRIDGEAANQLGMLAGSDLWQVDSEIQKLAAYADGRPVTAGMVREVTSASGSPTIFMLVDAIVEGKHKEARQRLEQMYRDGIGAGHVFSMVDRQLRFIAQFVEGRDQRGAPPSGGELAGLHEFARRRASDQARRFDVNRVRAAFEALLSADRSIKTGASTDHLALEQMVSDLLRVAGRR